MDFVIITGMSGAGKSRALHTLEDIGFYCVDNMPPQLISRIADLSAAAGGALSRVAVVTDMRGGNMFYGLFHEMDALQEEGFSYKLLFLDASDGELIRRYKEPPPPAGRFGRRGAGGPDRRRAEGPQRSAPPGRLPD